MKTRPCLILFGFLCLLNTVKSQCDVTQRKEPEIDFPDIMKYVAESYIMGVEYSVPGKKQTDYYTEYYDDALNRGRLDSHISGSNKKFIYKADTLESWQLHRRNCDLKLINTTIDFLKEHTDWFYIPKGTKNPQTIGPSAMFKMGLAAWKQNKIEPEMVPYIAYMGKAPDLIRGEKAIFWRRCIENGYMDYYFADAGDENPFDSDKLGKAITPLRIAVNSKDKQEFYDIISFQPFIPADLYPFELPKGLNCGRAAQSDGPKLPDYTGKSLFLSSEVVYEKYSTEDDSFELLSSYYSTLMFALDNELNHLAYYYSSWNTSKPDKEHQEPFINVPQYVIYDIDHQYAYKINYETGKCDLTRQKSFIPQYKLPENKGNIALTDPYVLFPNNELAFLSTGLTRGLAVNIFEAGLKDYVLDKETIIDKVYASHSYLKPNEQQENTVEIKTAPTQVQLHFFRKENPNIEEVLTFNIFGFTTRIPGKQYLFDITRCFKNDDDYSYLTIGFEVQSALLDQLQNKLQEIEQNVLSEVTLKSELNDMRIPAIMTDVKNGYVYVTLLVLDKPNIQLDFNEAEEDKSVVVSSPDDTQGMSTFEDCANACLSDRNLCWGFSLCGATCYFGSDTNVKVEKKSGCNLYRVYSNSSYMPSKDHEIRNLVSFIDSGEFSIMVALESGDRISMKATIAQVTDPAEDDELFEKMGNKLNPRMKIYKPASKLKKGTEVKNLGKLRYDECQRLCLDFKNCETLSYCLINGHCIISSKYANELTTGDIESDDLCNIVTRKYTDHFERTPGIVMKGSGGTEIKVSSLEDCSRECLKDDKCLSFDHCSGSEKMTCNVYNVHFLNSKSRKDAGDKTPSCGHYTKKFSYDFKKKEEIRLLGSNVPPLLNLTLEECAKSCIDYGQGSCYGYDFCQDASLFATSCTLFDSDPSRLKSSYSSICTNYIRTQGAYAPHPFTNAYAGGIGFLCFLVGIVIGGVLMFVIAYIKVNRQN